MFEPPIRPAKMNDIERHQFVQKAKADRLAFDAAQLLSQGEMDQAQALAGQGMTIAGQEQLAHWLRHYATTRFKISNRTIDEFLDGMPAANVAL